MELREGRARGAGIDLAFLEAGPSDGPLALCLHGFPDTAWTWRHLLGDLAGAGYRAVAPFLRGYAPSPVPEDGRYQTGALVADATALHESLGGDGDAVVIGHDWGSMAAMGAAAFAPQRWRRAVGLAVPPSGALAKGFFSYDQLKRSFYMYLFQTPLAPGIVGADGMAFLDRLWADWSPGYDASDDLPRVKEALGHPANLEAAIGYYRAQFDPSRHDPHLAAEQQAASAGAGPQPTLYLHGADDGCIGADLAEEAADFLAPGSEAVTLSGCGHFLHLERPGKVNARILAFLLPGR